MSEAIKKPYELSLWADLLAPSPIKEGETYYKEQKIATIGSDKMTAPNRAFDVVLTENINGEKTLKFSLRHKFYDDNLNELRDNPFLSYLTNERKVKLLYGDTWYEFVIKEVEETSEEYVFSYTAKDLFALELSKTGYNITFDKELNNNQGTVTELAEKVLEGTDWIVDKDNSDLLQQKVKEPLYQCKITQVGDDLRVLNVDTEEAVTDIELNEIIYVFYSYVTNKNGIYIQFIRDKDKKAETKDGVEIREFDVDSEDIIISTNYRFLDEASFTEVDGQITEIVIKGTTNDTIITIEEIYNLNQAYRLVYNQKTLYDPIMKKTVNLYQASFEDTTQDIYGYSDFQYITSNIVTSFVTNGADFSILEDDSIQGWSQYVPSFESAESKTIDEDTTSQLSLSDLNIDRLIGIDLKLAESETEEYTKYTNYTFNNTTKILSFNEALHVDDELIIKYIPTEYTEKGEPVKSVSIVPPLGVQTYPEVKHTIDLSKIQNFANIRGFLELQFAGKYDSKKGTDAYFNSGIENNSAVLDHIAAGEKFVLRLSYGYAEEKHGTLNPYDCTEDGKGIRALVAKYEMVDREFKTKDGETEVRRAFRIIPNSIIMDFDGTFEKANNYIEGGYFNDSSRTSYIIDNVAQTPSTKYRYKVEGDTNEYVWDGDKNVYVKAEEASMCLDYYMTTAIARTSVSTETLTDPSTNIGIFLYTKDEDLIKTDVIDRYIYIEDIQLTRYYLDDKNKIVTLGNVPESKTIETKYYYLKPTNRTKGEATNIYSDLAYLAKESGLVFEDIQPVYNEYCEKVLSIQETQSNCFNLLQTLCETFECWLKLEVEHEENGAIVLDQNLQPIKKVSFKEFIGKDNFAGFKYGINLNSISRTIDSNEIVTKLIVDNVTSEYTESGSLSIQDASSNPSKESYILNFSHYFNTNIIQDKYTCNKDVSEFNNKLSELNKDIFDIQSQRIKLDNAINVSKANTNTLELTLKEAQTMNNTSLTRFEQATGMSYSTYVEKYNEDPDSVANLLENDDIIDIIGEIYTSAITINNYSGIVSNLKQEYNKLFFQLYGAKEYGINIVTAPNTTSSVGEKHIYTTEVILDDYLTGLNLVLINSDGYEQRLESSLNEKHFTATVESGKPFVRCVFKSLPEHYKLQYYKDGKSYISNKTTDIIFSIYADDLDSSVTKRFKLVPDERWKNTYPNLDKLIEEKTEEKKALEKDFYKKYSRFIQEGTWSSSDYVDPELYYLDAQQVSRTSAQPKVTYSIQVSEISELEGYGNYYFTVGDKTYVEDENFFGTVSTIINRKIFVTPIKEEVVISEVEWHLDEPENNTITVQNYKTQFEDLFQRISAAVQTVQYNEIAYPKTSSILDTNGLLDTDLLLRSWNNSVGPGYNLTSDGTVATDANGVLVQDLTNSANLVRIESRGIKISSDGGQTWLNALDGRGINADVLNAGVINTQQIWLMDSDNPSFRWDKAGISAYGFDRNEEEPYDLKTYVRFDKYGLYGVQDGENFVASSLTDIKNTAKFGLTWGGFFIKNSYTNGYVSISSDDDFQIVTEDEEQELYIPGYEQQSIELSSIGKTTVIFPYDNCSIIGVYDLGESGETLVDDYSFEDKTITILETIKKEVERLINENTTTQLDLSELQIDNLYEITLNEQEYTDYTFDSETQTLYFNEELIPEDVLLIKYIPIEYYFRIDYINLLNTIDLGGKGIIEINSIILNGQEYEGDYSYNKEEGLLTLPIELMPGDQIIISYKLERIKIGATKFDNDGAPSKYGIEVRNKLGETVFETNDEGNLSVTGTINATDGVFRGTVYAQDGEFTGHIRAISGEFPGSVTVGDENDNYITISGENGEPFIASGSYLNNEDEGWIINGDGNAVFNNVSVRGAIRTSVFEKGEIQTVGGAFLFRPSDVIEQAALQITDVDGEERADLVLTMKQRGSFKVGDLCKLGEIENLVGGLQTIYEVSEVSLDGYTIVLAGAGEIFKERISNDRN